MGTQYPPRPPSRRPPLGEVTRRINNSQSEQMPLRKKGSVIHHESLKPDGLLQVRSPGVDPSAPPKGDNRPLQERDPHIVAVPRPNVANPRLSAISKEYPESNRNSQISTTSSYGSDGMGVKKAVGPWRLGNDLGSGATARVRKARHRYTGQEAAVKIIQKTNAKLSQAGSIANFDEAESQKVENGERKIPIGILREITIMKLTEHPHILKLYDIWENRTEIYLVLEYVDNHELWNYIADNICLEEEEAMRIFRQMLSAVGYCHSFKICHRDLKPENILFTKGRDIKIADFGMAALQQSPNHKLTTACGSPHYAAPELIKGKGYHGEKIDVWSMGVILYAMLCGGMPFQHDESGTMASLLHRIRKGVYEMAPEFSRDARDLIWRILQVNPKNRIDLDQIWQHPAVRKYDYLDDFRGGSNPMSLTPSDCGRPVLRRSDIDSELVAQLRSMWHMFTERQIVDALMNEESNEQKMFYTLLLKFKENQLENFFPDVQHSPSDYHHFKPQKLSKTYSTCHFPQQKSKGHKKQGSRFTVISNVPETEYSYDPFKASRPQHLDSIRHSGPKVTILSTETSMAPGRPRQGSRASAANSVEADRGRLQRPVQPRGYASRSSLASSTRSRSSAPYVRAQIGPKRGVSFTHLRRQSAGSPRRFSGNVPSPGAVGSHNNHIEVADDEGDIPYAVAETSASSRYIRSRKPLAPVPLLVPQKPVRRTSILWKDDVRQLSSSLAKDCDEAFNRASSILDESQESQLSLFEQSRGLSALHTVNPQVTARPSKRISLSSRPLPPPPARTESIKDELIEARKQAELRKLSGDDSPSHLDRMVLHIDRLMIPSSPDRGQGNRRATSTPGDTKQFIAMRPLPSIYETRGEEISPRHTSDFHGFLEQKRRGEVKTSRIASAPEPRGTYKTQKFDYDEFSRPDTYVRDTIRVVDPSSPLSPVKMPAPLIIRKKSSQAGADPDVDSHTNRKRSSGFDLRQQYHVGSKIEVDSNLGRIDESLGNETQFTNESNSGTVLKKKASWFRRNSKSGDANDFNTSDSRGNTTHSRTLSNESARPNLDGPLPIPPKKKGFSLGRLFKKRGSISDMTVEANNIFDDNASMQESIVEGHKYHHARNTSGEDDQRSRQIEPQRNWLAKLFHVKPVSKFICFCVPKRRARQELTSLLKEWRRYGIKDVEIDKQRNIVFGKVGAKNYLDMKEVAFAAEIFTLIHQPRKHGKKKFLSIARVTQERGAASSFHKVVETLTTVLQIRGVLITEEMTTRMMIKTLNSLRTG